MNAGLATVSLPSVLPPAIGIPTAAASYPFVQPVAPATFVEPLGPHLETAGPSMETATEGSANGDIGREDSRAESDDDAAGGVYALCV